MAKLLAVVLKAVIPVIPRGAKERVMLKEDLGLMDCHGLMEQPWCLKYDKIIAELLMDRDNRWARTLHHDLDKCTTAAWRKVYNFPIHSEGMVALIEKFVDGKFKNLPSPKDRYVVVDCKDVRAKRVLEFLVLLLYPKKPIRIIVTIGNTIFGALTGEREVDWALVIRDIVKRLYTAVGKSKASPLRPYLFHLYITHDATLLEDKKAYLIEESMLKHNVEPDEEGAHWLGRFEAGKLRCYRDCGAPSIAVEALSNPPQEDTKQRKKRVGCKGERGGHDHLAKIGESILTYHCHGANYPRQILVPKKVDPGHGYDGQSGRYG